MAKSIFILTVVILVSCSAYPEPTFLFGTKDYGHLFRDVADELAPASENVANRAGKFFSSIVEATGNVGGAIGDTLGELSFFAGPRHPKGRAENSVSDIDQWFHAGLPENDVNRPVNLDDGVSVPPAGKLAEGPDNYNYPGSSQQPKVIYVYHPAKRE